MEQEVLVPYDQPVMAVLDEYCEKVYNAKRPLGFLRI